jgi:hypothetical protein
MDLVSQDCANRGVITLEDLPGLTPILELRGEQTGLWVSDVQRYI